MLIYFLKEFGSIDTNKIKAVTDRNTIHVSGHVVILHAWSLKEEPNGRVSQGGGGGRGCFLFSP